MERHIRPSTLKGYRDIWAKHLRPRCADSWLKDVKTYHVQGWLDEIAKAEPLGRRTLQHIKCSLSAIFKLAKQQGFFEGENPVRDTAVAPEAKAPQQTYAYSLDEITAMLSVMPESAATIFATAAFTGLRRGEICGLRWEDYRDGEIKVCRSIWEGHETAPKTSQSAGTVPVIKPLARMLDTHRLRCGNPDSGPMFATINGKPRSLNNVLARSILPALRRANLQTLWHGWHAARRGLASNLYALGVKEKTIQEILRHANVSTTNTYYIKTASADKSAAMATLEGSISLLGSNWAADLPTSATSPAVN